MGKAPPSSFSLKTDPFLEQWHTALTKEKTWMEFVQMIRDDTGPSGVARSHADYFTGPKGRAALLETTQDYVAWMNESGSAITVASADEDEVLHYFYSEKVLSKCNALRSSKQFGKVRRPTGWKTRMGVRKGGGGPKADWTARKKMFSDYIEKEK